MFWVDFHKKDSLEQGLKKEKLVFTVLSCLWNICLQGLAKIVQEYSVPANPALWLAGTAGMSKFVSFMLLNTCQIE